MSIFLQEIFPSVTFIEGKGNVCCSPLSIEVALLMTLEGARGETAKELQQALHLPDNENVSEEVKNLLDRLNRMGQSGNFLQIVNALFVKQRFKVSFWSLKFLFQIGNRLNRFKGSTPLCSFSKIITNRIYLRTRNYTLFWKSKSVKVQ